MKRAPVRVEIISWKTLMRWSLPFVINFLTSDLVFFVDTNKSEFAVCQVLDLEAHGNKLAKTSF